MKWSRVLFLPAGGWLTAALLGQGTVTFNNYVPASGVNAPIYDASGVTPLSGPRYLAQLYAGPSAATLQAVGDPVTFRFSPGAGYLQPPVGGLSREIPSVLPGTIAFVQIRVWDTLFGATNYEQAVVLSSSHGFSGIIQVKTGGDGSPPSLPADLVGLTSFSFTSGSPPVIAQAPGGQGVAIGGTLALSVVAAGTGPFSYQWSKDGTPIGGAVSSTLSLNNVQTTDAGAYTVTVTGALGTVTSLPAVVMVFGAPVIKIGPAAATVAVGDTVTFNVAVNGVGPFFYQWRFNGANLAGAQSSNLVLTAVQAAQAGDYSVVVGNTAGSVTSANAHLTVNFGLTITPPVGGTVQVVPLQPNYAPGSTVTLTAAASPGFTFVGWSGAASGTSNPLQLTINANQTIAAGFAPQFGTLNAANRVLWDGIDAPILDTDGVTLLTGAAYRAQVYAGSTTNSLAPIGNPVAIGPPGYFDGGVLQVPGISPGGLAAAQVRAWDTTAGATYEAASAAGGKRGASAAILLMTGGVGNPPTVPGNLEGVQSFALVSGFGPTITTQPTSQTVMAGANVDLSVSATGGTALTYQWSKDGAAIPNATNSVLHLLSVSPASAGTYTVQVSNAAGATTSTGAVLSVQVPATAPSITTQPASTNILVGGSAVLTVVATGSGPLSYQWYAGTTGDTSTPVGSNSSTFNIGAIQTEGTFWVRVSGPGGSADSMAAVVSTTKLAQQIAFAPLNGPFTYGAPAVLLTNAVASSGLVVTYQVVSGPATLLGNVALSFTGAGTVVIRALQAGNTTYLPAAPVDQSVVVAKAPGTVSLTGLTQTYDGNSKLATATTTPSGLAVALTYNGQSVPPVSAGAYAVVGSITDSNYVGSASGTLTVQQASQVITFPAVAAQVFGGPPVLLGASASSRLAVSYSVVSGPGTVAGNVLTPTGAGTIVVQATQAGDANRLAASPISQNVLVAKGTATVTLGGLSQTYDGTAKPVVATTAPAGLALTLSYNGQATLPTNAGSYAVVATVTDANWLGGTNGALTVAKANATVSIGGLTPTYDGASKRAIVSTTPAGLGLLITYGGQITPPVNAGTYPVVATVNDPNYQGRASATLTVKPAIAILSLSALSQTYDGAAKPAIVTTTPSGLGLIITYNGVSSAPTNAGSYTVGVTLIDPNYLGGTNATLVIDKATAGLSLNGLSSTYDGTAKAVSVNTVPAGLAMTITYGGQSTAPTNAGTYAVVVSVTDVNYQAATNATLTVAQAPQTISFAAVAPQNFGAGPVPLNVTASSGLQVGLAVLSGPGTLTGTNLTLTGAGVVVVQAQQAGDANRLAAAPVTQSVTVNKAKAIVSMGALKQNYDGNPKGVIVSTTPAGLPLVITYDGATNAPAGAGSYAVLAQVNDPNYQGSTTGTLQILGQVAGLVFNDLNGNGVREAGEAGLAQAPITLLSSNGTQTVATTATGADGSFVFFQLPAGSYVVHQTAPTGFTITSPNDVSVIVGTNGLGTVTFADQAGVVAARLQIVRSANQVQISWTGGGVLQSANTISGPWTDLGQANPALFTIATGARFFRVKQ